MREFAVAVACLLVAAPASAAEEHPLWGKLEPGPHAVAFRFEYISDPSRVVRPERALEGDPVDSVERRFTIATWYPAKATRGAKPMTLADYVHLRAHIYAEDDRRHEGVTTAATREQAVRSLSTFGIFTGVPEAAWPPLLRAPMRAVRDAQRAEGKFPLVVLIPGAFGSGPDLPLFGEYIASHGFVAMSASGQGTDFLNTHVADAAHFEAQVRDAEHVLGHTIGWPFADRRRVAVVGFSRGAAAAALLAMRNPAVDAMVSWDGSISTSTIPQLERSASFDPARLAVPLLSVHIGETAAGPALFDRVRYADRYALAVTGIHHVDFILGMVQTALGASNQFIKSPPGDIRRTVESIHRFTLAFLKKTLSGAAIDLPRAAADLEPRGVFRFQATPGQTPPPSAALLLERIHQKEGITSAKSIIADARRREPEWIPFPEGVLRFVGARFEELGRSGEVLPVLELNVELYPKSARAWTQLAAAQEKAGDRVAALRSYARALEIDAEHAPAREAVKRLEGARPESPDRLEEP